MDYFSDDPLGDLVAEFPDWTRADDSTSELYKWLGAIAGQHAKLDAAAEQLVADTILAKASAQGLYDEWAYVYGIRSDIQQSTLNTEQLRQYVRAWVVCDGSKQGLTNLLLAIILLDPRNNIWGALVTFDAGGAGLTFPAGGSGIGPLYQFSTKPDPTGGFVFNLDGSGLTFPDPAWYFPADGSGIVLGSFNFPNFTTLAFPNGAPWVTVTEDLTHYGLTVSIKTWLAFDRGAINRALDRFRQAHVSPTVYTETN